LAAHRKTRHVLCLVSYQTASGKWWLGVRDRESAQIPHKVPTNGKYQQPTKGLCRSVYHIVDTVQYIFQDCQL